MKTLLTLFIFFGNLAIAQQPVKPDTAQFIPRVYNARIVRYLPTPPDSLQYNPFVDLKTDSVKSAKVK